MEEKVVVKIPNELTGEMEKKEMTRIQITRLKHFNNVLKGDMAAISLAYDRSMDRAAQPIVGDEEQPVAIRIDF